MTNLDHDVIWAGDHDTRRRELEHTLSLSPRDILANIRMADWHLANNDTRAASAFYAVALKLASQSKITPPHLAPELARARAAQADLMEQYRLALMSRLRADGFDPDRSSRRFAQSLDVMLGRQRIFIQEPRVFYFPGLPQVAFYANERFPWLANIEAETDDIRREALEVLVSGEGLEPYIQAERNRPTFDVRGLLDNPNWSAYFLWKNGAPVESALRKCPITAAALEKIPLAQIEGRTPSVLFSVLRPGARIPPHHGMINTRLICHLPLIAPPGCAFRVGAETRPWIAGKAWAFDDTIEHEAWNNSGETRVILIFEIWKPELSDEERALVASLFQAIDSLGGPRQDWTN